MTRKVHSATRKRQTAATLLAACFIGGGLLAQPAWAKGGAGGAGAARHGPGPGHVTVGVVAPVSMRHAQISSPRPVALVHTTRPFRSHPATRGQFAALGPLNAAHASPEALAHASPRSMVGKIATYGRAMLAALSMPT